MVSYKTIKSRSLGVCCRECINKQYYLTLQTKDCIYIPYKYSCADCHQTKNIVDDIIVTRRYKLLFGRQIKVFGN